MGELCSVMVPSCFDSGVAAWLLHAPGSDDMERLSCKSPTRLARQPRTFSVSGGQYLNLMREKVPRTEAMTSKSPHCTVCKQIAARRLRRSQRAIYVHRASSKMI